MTDELISCLMTIGALRVASRTSVMRYRDTQNPAADRAGVAGRVDRRGAPCCSRVRVRITAHLIEAATDRQLWGSTYEKDVAEVLSLQSAVATEIARGMRVTLTSAERSSIATSTPSRSGGLRRLPARTPLLEQADPRRPGSGGRLLPPRD